MEDYSQDVIVSTEKGYLVRIIIKISYLSGPPQPEFPDNCKFKWLAWRLGSRPKDYILLDNHKGKGPHWHDNEKEEFFTWTKIINNNSMKKFTFKYDPQHSVSKMFDEMEQAVKIKTRSIQPKNVVITNNIEVIYQVLNKPRLDLYSYLVAKQPNSVAELSNLLKREPAEV
ncbi:13752_t:CDS:2, partial [Cetraspora pellucida]